MIAGGVSFQPGASDDRNKINPNAPNGTQEGVQEAIKVLSLRVPRVVGAYGITSKGLMESPGSNGAGSRVDGVVNSVLSRMFPTGQPQQSAQSFGMAPSYDAPANAPDFSGGYASPAYAPQRANTPSFDYSNFITNPDGTPRVIFGGPPGGSLPPRWPNQAGVDGGAGFPPAMIGELPGSFDFNQRPATMAPTPWTQPQPSPAPSDQMEWSRI